MRRLRSLPFPDQYERRPEVRRRQRFLLAGDGPFDLLPHRLQASLTQCVRLGEAALEPSIEDSMNRLVDSSLTFQRLATTERLPANRKALVSPTMPSPRDNFPLAVSHADSTTRSAFNRRLKISDIFSTSLSGAPVLSGEKTSAGWAIHLTWSPMTAWVAK